VTPGARLGAGASVPHGPIVGATVGSGVGATVGSGVGATVGSGVGATVGPIVGATVGSGVGATVGSGVGATVGSGVGATVGSGVGATEGEGAIEGLACTDGEADGLATAVVASGLAVGSSDSKRPDSKPPVPKKMAQAKINAKTAMIAPTHHLLTGSSM